MTLDEASGPPVEVWPDNLQAVNIFIQMGTQWRIGLSGTTGLEYSSLPVVMRLSGIPRSEWPEIFESIRILESAALEAMRKK